MDVGTGFSFSRERGFSLGEEAFDERLNRPPAENIRELEGKLKGDERDAELLVELAKLRAQLGATNRAEAELAKSLAYFRSRLGASPGDGWLQTLYGGALLTDGRTEEAERAYRAAVGTSPGDWRCWDGLGAFLSGRVLQTLMVTNAVAGAGGGVDRTLARRDWEEAMRCYDRAVEVAPGVMEVYAGRFAARYSYRTMILPVLEPGEGGGDPMLRSLPDEAALKDLKRAAELTSTNAFLIGAAVAFEMFSGMRAPDEFDPDSGGLWRSATEPRKAYFQGQLRRLEELAGASSARVAGGALAASATLRFLLMGDAARAEGEARRALARYPAGEAAWSVLVGSLVVRERWAELAAVSRERLGKVDTSKVRMGLAKALEQEGKFAEAEAEVAAAARRQPGDLFIEVSGVALRLRRAESETAVAEVLSAMERMKAAAVASPLRAHFEFLHGIAYGLAGNVAEARGHFRRLMAADPEDENYRKAMEALGPL